MSSNNYSITITTNEHIQLSDEIEEKFKNRDRTSSKCVEKIRSTKENSEDDVSKQILYRSPKGISPTKGLEVTKGINSRHNSKQSSSVNLVNNGNSNCNSLNVTKYKDKSKTEDIFIRNDKHDELEMIVSKCLSKGFEFEKTIEELEKLNFIKTDNKDKVDEDEVDKDKNSPNHETIEENKNNDL